MNMGPAVRHHLRLPVLGIIGILLLAAQVTWAASAPTPAPTESVLTDGAMSFRDIVQLSLEQSPQLKKTSLEIERSKLDLADARWSYLPKISLTTSYSFYPFPRNAENARTQAFTLNFSASQFDPVRSYFSVAAHKFICRLAVYNHLATVSDGLYTLANAVLEREALEKQIALSEEAVTVAENQLRYLREIRKYGRAGAMDEEEAANSLAIYKNNLKKNHMQLTFLDGKIKSMLVLPLEARLDIDYGKAREQILGGFHPELVGLEQVRSNSFKLKMSAIKNNLQGYRIKEAYAAYLPTFTFSVKPPDLLQNSEIIGADGRRYPTEVEEDYYVTLSLNLPVWDNMDRARDVSRQKRLRDSLEVEEKVLDQQVVTEWEQGKEKLAMAASALELAQSVEDLERRKVEREEILYHSGGSDLNTVHKLHLIHLAARGSTINASLEYDRILLNLRYMSGDFFREYINVSDWEI